MNEDDRESEYIETVLGFGTATGTHIVSSGVATNSAAGQNLNTDQQKASQDVAESRTVLEYARDGVGTATDTNKVTEGVATQSKKGDGQDKVL